MKKTYQIQITSPCSEDWNNMTPAEQGRFCSKCAKQVINFEDKSDREIIDFLLQSKTPVCGRIATEKMNRLLVEESALRGLRYSLIASSLLVLLSTGVYAQDYSRKLIAKKTTQKVAIPAEKDSLILQDSLPKISNILRGKVVDQATGEALAFANVWVNKDMNLAMNTDFKGEFAIVIDDYNALPDSFLVSVSYIGYEEFKTYLQKDNFPANEIMEIKLKEGGCDMTLGKIIIYEEKPKSKKRRKKRN